MATITVIGASDVIANSRADLNTNFSNLNSDKIETSVLDTDTTLAANSDAKVATQKAVKAYVDAGGNVNASTTAKGIVEEATAAEVEAGTAAGATGARLFINPSTLSSIVKYGGTGADGALAITSGATNIDCAGASVVRKNYTSISITGTGSLTFTNPASTGTIVILKSQGAVTITTSTNPAIDLRSMGGVLGAGGVKTNGVAGTAGTGSPISSGGGALGTEAAPGAGGAGGTTPALSSVFVKGVYVSCGSGGGGGGGENGAGRCGGGGGGGGGASTAGTAGGTPTNGAGDGNGGDGGRGGGVLYIECAGALNITSVINAAGAAGAAGSANAAGGGGGGGGGSIVILYKTLTANSGTYTVTGGAGGAASGTGGAGGAGGTGMSYVAANTEIV